LTRKPRRTRSFRAAIVGAALVLAAPAALAGLLDAGNAADACPKLEDSNRLDPAVAAKYQLGRCYEAIGKTASAWALYTAVADAAKRINNADAEAIARARAEALEGKLARLSIEVAAETKAVAGLAIKRDATEIGVGTIGLAIPLDPGPHEIVVSASGYKAWRTTVDLEPGPRTEKVLVPALEREPAKTQAASKPVAPDQPGLAPAEPRTTPWRTVGWIGFGVGGATAIAGGVLLAVAKSSYNAVSSRCGATIGQPSNVCEPGAVDERNSAYSQANVAGWVIVGGAVVAAGGVALVLTAPRKGGPETPRVALGMVPGGVAVRGAF